MTTLADLLKKNKEEVYGGLAGAAYIESRGLINAPRQAALLVNSPTTLGSLIGNELGGLVKGSAKRPSDTIFSDKKPFKKSVSLIPGAITGLPDSVEKDKSYYVKTQSPGDSIVGKVMFGPKKPKDIAANVATEAAKNPIEFGRKLKKAFSSAKKSSTNELRYAPGKSDGIDGKLVKETIKFSEYAPTYTQNENNQWGFSGAGDQKRNGKKLDDVIQNILKTDPRDGAGLINKIIKDSEKTSTPYVLFEVYNKGTRILLPGTIGGLSETITPEWGTFKYLGSAFNLYRYSGVERQLSFDLKMYYIDTETKAAMIENLHRLRSLVFPDNQLAAIQYPGGANDEKKYSGIAIKPNLVWLTMIGIYKDVLGIIDSLTFTIDEATSWSTIYEKDESGQIIISQEMNDANSTSPTTQIYPSVINVSIGMKIIETPSITKGKNDIYGYEYGAGGSNYFTHPTIYQRSKDKSTNASNNKLKPVTNGK